jgi:cell division septation protein DedD
MAELDNLEQTEALEFEDDSLPELPDDNPFEETNSKRPWLYIGIGILAVTLVAVVVLKLTTGGHKEDTGLIEIPIDVTGQADAISDSDFVEQANRIVSSDPAKPTDMPERVVENRKDVTFDPDKPTVSRPKPKPINAPAKKTAAQTAPKSGLWYAQVGAYNTRAAAETGQRQLRDAHGSLFSGHNFVILAAEVNGRTVHRLRVTGFQTSGDANNFCKNAHSDGVSGCYVTK